MRSELGTDQNCNILIPTLMAVTAFLSRSPGLLNRGPGGPASRGHGPHSSIFSPTDPNSNCSIGGPECPLCWVLVLSTASFLQLRDFLSSPGLYNCSTSTFFLWASQIRTQFNPSTVKIALDLLISSTGCTCYLHRYISSFDSLAGSEVNIQH